MIFTHLIDRERERARLTAALARTDRQFIVLYGRRRIGKSTLLRDVLSAQAHAVYFLADRTGEVNQRFLFSMAAGTVVPDFEKATYADWESLLRSFNRQLPRRLTLCLDEFPYLVKSCPALPSIIQKLLNERELRFDLIICGSSQQLMQGYVLDKREPLYGLADEIIRLQPIPARFIGPALGCSAEEAVCEYAVWGGVPRYWELRKDYPSLMEAVSALMLDPNGLLVEEPGRLLRDDLRDSVQPETLLSIIGNGASKMSEIASRLGKGASQLTQPLSKLKELGYVNREIPFGEDEKKSKRGTYHLSDSLFRFLYRFVIPYRSILQLGRASTVKQVIHAHLNQYVAECWECLCRDYVSGNSIEGIPYNAAGRWWGKVFPDGDRVGQMVELDVVAESLDKKHILIGECKWTAAEEAPRLFKRLETIKPWLPFVKEGQQVHTVLFLKQPARHAEDFRQRIFLPEDVLA